MAKLIRLFSVFGVDAMALVAQIFDFMLYTSLGDSHRAYSAAFRAIRAIDDTPDMTPAQALAIIDAWTADVKKISAYAGVAHNAHQAAKALRIMVTPASEEAPASEE